MNNLVFKNESFHKFKFLTEFKNILDEAIKEFNLDKFIEVDLLFVVAPKMKKLNKLYRNKNYVTDVLSFPFESNLEFSFLDTIPLGQIIISP
jgi:Predicted metal-dependent hydrolase